MKWHYIKDEGYPKWYADIIVKCEYGDVLKTYSSYEDDDVLDEEMSMTAISAAVSHVSDLFSILLTDGICCGKEYRELVGLDELDILKRKLSKRIIELDDMIGKDDE